MSKLSRRRLVGGAIVAGAVAMPNIAGARAAEAAFALNEMERLNVEALAALTERHNVKIRILPAAMIEAARRHARDVTGDFAARSEIARRIVESYSGFRECAGRWSKCFREGGARLAGRHVEGGPLHAGLRDLRG
jgi:hypothetical protein